MTGRDESDDAVPPASPTTPTPGYGEGKETGEGERPGETEDAALFDAGGKVDRDAIYRQHETRSDDDTPVQVRLELTRDLKKRLDRYLVDRIPFMSRTALQRLIDEDAVTVNGRRPKASTRLRLGDVVEAVLPPPPSNEIPPENIPLDVLFEDDHLIVLNKQPDIIAHPARAMKSGTIVNALSWRFRHETSGGLSSVGEEFARPGVVHRLDRFTSGAMVAAKTDTAHWRLGHQFQARTVDKRYLAIVPRRGASRSGPDRSSARASPQDLRPLRGFVTTRPARRRGRSIASANGTTASRSSSSSSSPVAPIRSESTSRRSAIRSSATTTTVDGSSPAGRWSRSVPKPTADRATPR